jgi:pimeloyl-ACP methyl ester carboxylesterase
LSNLRTHGSPPYEAAVIHGGPGAAGEVAPVARMLSRSWGILEPLQTRLTIRDLVEELHQEIAASSSSPIVSIGHSWGAWLALLHAARYPSDVRRVVLVASGPFEEKYIESIGRTRESRLTGQENAEVREVAASLSDRGSTGRTAALARFGQLLARADSFDPIPADPDAEAVVVDPAAYGSIWPQAAELRRSGELLRIAGAVRCPVLALHGDYDPHPADGVRLPLSRVVRDFRFVLLDRCGHRPWEERQARDSFFRILGEELDGQAPATGARCG